MKEKEEGFEFNCPSCHTLLTVPYMDEGEAAQCPACGVGFLVPHPSVDKQAPATGPRTAKRRRVHAQPAIVLAHPPPPPSRGLTFQQLLLTGILVMLALLVGISWPRGESVSVLPPPPTPTPTPEPGPGGLARTHIASTVTTSSGRTFIAGLVPSHDAFPATPARTVYLVDQVGLRNIGFVAEVTPDQKSLLWRSLFGANLVHPSHLVVAPNGELLLVARALSRLPGLSLPGASGIEAGMPVVVKLSGDGSRVIWIRKAGAPNATVRNLAVDARGTVTWTSESPGAAPTSHRLDSRGF